MGQPQLLDARETLCSHREQGGDVYLVTSGLLRTETRGKVDAHLVDLALTGDLVAPPGLALGTEDAMHMGFSAMSTMPTTVITMSLAGLLDAFTDDEAVQSWLFGHLSTRTQRTYLRQLDLVTCNVSHRVAALLCTYSELAGGAKQLSWREDLSQRDIAALVRAERATVNRVLHDFERRGWLSRDSGLLQLRSIDGLAWHGRRCRWLASRAVVAAAGSAEPRAQTA
jgi:CRP-like cAMP-binding protein